MNSHTFDQRSWRLIKDFGGIYGTKMDYTKIIKLSKDKITKAYFDDAKLPLEPFEVSIVYRAKYNQNGRIISLAPDTPCGTQPFDKGVQEWKTLILKKAAQGYKNREFYEALAKMVAPPPKVTCVCGLKMGLSRIQQYKHYQSPTHINRMLKCVPVKNVQSLDGLIEPRVLSKQGHPYKVCLKRPWVNFPQYHDYKTISLLPLMLDRETDEEWKEMNAKEKKQREKLYTNCGNMLDDDDFLSCFGATGGGWTLAR